MSSLADVALPEAQAPPWSVRNQRWLSERLAFWRRRIERHAADAADEPVPSTIDSAHDFEPAALRLRALFGLSAFETELVVLAAGVEIDDGLRDAVAQAQGVAAGQTVRLSFSLALALLPDSHWDALSPVGPLRHWSLLQFDTSAGFTRGLMRIDERVLHHVTGVPAFDERLIGLAHFEDRAVDLRGDDFATRIAKAMGGTRRPLVMLADATQDATRRRIGRSLAHAAFEQMGLRTLWVETSACEGDAREVVETARRIDREAALSSAGLVLACDAEGNHGAGLLQLLAALRGPIVVLGAPASSHLADLTGRHVWRFNLPLEDESPRDALPPLVQRAADRALQQFRVEPALLDQALASVSGLDEECAVEARLWEALRQSSRGGLDGLAQRIDSRATFEDLVVPPLVASQLREIASQLRHRHRVYAEWGFGERHARGLGIAALFAGESGTGKTLAAEAIANEARLDLYRIDLSSVVSKYIGETEKNLSRLFDAAERSGAVLLFDEADALFGKRSEVKDSHDRYANIEIAYLLQRIDGYRGLAILTTNMKSALDRAFLRRIRFMVQFPFPDDVARERIWRRQFPDRAPLGTIDFPALARIRLAGGDIRAVALAAAFKACERGESLGQSLLVDAARAELIKLERPMTGTA
jgi:ATPase family protein associated with various cellular activities (AAA)/winged helix domain-containing protein